MFDIALPSEDEAAVTTLVVLALTTAATDDEALSISDSVASEPVSSPAPVNVRAAALHTSVASVPKVVRLRVPTAHTAAGMPDTEDATEDRIEPIDDDAARTMELVLALTTAAIDEEAVRIAASVFALTSEVMPAVAEFVLALTTAATDDEALSISDSVASEPVSSPAPVRVRVALLHTSTASVPNEVSVLVPYAHTSAGIDRKDEMTDPRVAPSDEDAAVTTALVLALTSAATDEDETMFEVITNVLSARTKSPAPSVPQDINAGHVPSVAAGVKE